MVGITSYGAYIPKYRLGRADISTSWGGPPLSGEKAIANFDEDSITMAVAASRDCINGINPKTINALYFASTSSPYKEKQAAATIGAVLDMKSEIFSMDISQSLRAGTNAIAAAMDSIQSNSAKNALVCAADIRLGLPNGPRELAYGDGAAAFTLGKENVIATIDGKYSISDEIIDVWRSDKDTYVRSWEDRFTKEKGYNKIVFEAVSGALKKYKLEPKDFSKAVFYSPDGRAVGSVARNLGFDIKTQVQDIMYDTAGNTGAALAPMLLVAALEEARPGDRLLLASYGDGCDVFILTVTPEIENIQAKNKRGIKCHLKSKKVLTSYEKYLRWRDIISVEPAPRPPLQVPSAVALWRDRKGGLALYGSKCKKCGMPQYPAQRICIKCQAKDEFEDYCFANRKATLFTFSHDNLAPAIDPPVTLSVVNFEGGGRITCDMTDREIEEVKVGMPVEMTFRKIRYAGGIYDYWWKCMPIRE
ncbi:MAG: hydroxymethylglutaryl-CoA synthase [Deltaproteobacteria bacterium]|nr:hydroxymethylglutaryl-CoA synthase [Deltaproteobacteria bacterium]